MDGLIDPYLRHSPMRESELDALPAFERLQWAIQARFFAGRVGAGSHIGSTRDDDAAALENIRRILTS